MLHGQGVKKLWIDNLAVLRALFLFLFVAPPSLPCVALPHIQERRPLTADNREDVFLLKLTVESNKEWLREWGKNKKVWAYPCWQTEHLTKLPRQRVRSSGGVLKRRERIECREGRRWAGRQQRRGLTESLQELLDQALSAQHHRSHLAVKVINAQTDLIYTITASWEPNALDLYWWTWKNCQLLSFYRSILDLPMMWRPFLMWCHWLQSFWILILPSSESDSYKAFMISSAWQVLAEILSRANLVY